WGTVGCWGCARARQVPRALAGPVSGGGGPFPAASFHNELGLPGVFSPPIPGAFSALGLVGTDLKRDYVQTLFTTADIADPAAVEAAFVVLERKGAAMLDRAGVAPERRRFERSVDARYRRQSYELQVPVPPGEVDKASQEKTGESFHARHLKTYGHQNRDEPVQLVNVRIAAIGAIPPLLVRNRTSPHGTNPVKSERQIWFRETGAIRAMIYDRRLMPSGLTLSGPAVIESLESTILVPPDWQAKMNQDGFILLQRIRRN